MATAATSTALIPYDARILNGNVQQLRNEGGGLMSINWRVPGRTGWIQSEGEVRVEQNGTLTWNGHDGERVYNWPAQNAEYAAFNWLLQAGTEIVRVAGESIRMGTQAVMEGASQGIDDMTNTAQGAIIGTAEQTTLAAMSMLDNHHMSSQQDLQQQREALRRVREQQEKEYNDMVAEMKRERERAKELVDGRQVALDAAQAAVNDQNNELTMLRKRVEKEKGDALSRLQATIVEHESQFAASQADLGDEEKARREGATTPQA